MMFTRGTAPPPGVKLSCAELTAPVEVPVVGPPRPDARPNRPPSPPCSRRTGWTSPTGSPKAVSFGSVGLERDRGERQAGPDHQHDCENGSSLALRHHAAERRRSRTAATIAYLRKSLNGPLLERVGGFTLKKPPPLVPSCGEIWLARDRRDDLFGPSTVLTVRLPWKFWITPWLVSAARTGTTGRGCASSCE